MRAKKFLEQQAEQDRQTILSENDAKFLRETKTKINANACAAPRSFPKLKLWLAVTTGVLVSVIILVCMFVLYPQSQNVVLYYENNFVTSDSTLQAMKDDMTEFTLCIDETLYTAKVEKTTDSVSGDVIMYKADIISNDALNKITIVSVCNKNYHYRGLTITSDFSFKKLSTYNVLYHSETIPDTDFGLDTLNARAIIQRNNGYLYITDYTETMFNGQSKFFDTIESLIK